MTRCVIPMAGEVVVMAVKEFENEIIGVSIGTPGRNHPQKEFVLLVRYALFEKLINRQCCRNLLLQHP